MPFPNLFKNAFGGLSPQVWLLALIMFINRSGTMVILFLSIYATQHLNFSLTQAGIIMGLFGAGSFLGVFVGGKLTDKIGGKWVMTGSLFFGGIMFLILGNLLQFHWFALGIFFTSFFGDAFRPANTAAIASYSSSANYTRSIALNRLAINLGFSIGPAMGGLLASISYSYLFIADGFTCIMAAIVIGVFLNKSRSKLSLKNEEKEDEKIALFESPYKDKKYMIFSFFCVLYAMGFLQMFSTMPLYYKQIHHLKEIQIGWLMALNGAIVVLVEMVFIYKMEGKINSLNFIFIGAILLMFNYILLMFNISSAWLIVSMLLITFSEILAMPFMSSYMMQRAGANNMGAYAAIYSMAWSIAHVISPLISMQIIAHYGFSYLWFFMAATCLLVGLGMRYILISKE